MPVEPSIHAQDSLRVEVLSEALPYIQRFRGRRVVIKYGGAAMVREDLRDAVFRDVALLASVGVEPLLFTGVDLRSTNGSTASRLKLFSRKACG